MLLPPLSLSLFLSLPTPTTPVHPQHIEPANKQADSNNNKHADLDRHHAAAVPDALLRAAAGRNESDLRRTAPNIRHPRVVVQHAGASPPPPPSTASKPTDTLAVQVQSVGAPYHNAYVQFTSVGTPGAYSAWVAPTGSPARVNLTASRLVLESGPGGLDFTGYLKAPLHTVYRQLGFINSPSTPLAASAWYGCDENGVQQTVVGPSGGVWCVAMDPIQGAYGLYVQDPDERGMFPPPTRKRTGLTRPVQADSAGRWSWR